MKRIVVVLVVLGLIAGGYVLVRDKLPGSLAPASAGAGELVFYGNVDIRQVELAFRVPGRIEQIFCEEGDALAPGDMVAGLDDKPYREELAVRQAELARAEAELQKLRNGFRAQEIQSARARLAERRAALKSLELEYRRRSEIVAEGAISRQSLDDIRAARDEARARVQSAKEDLALLLEGYRAEDIRAAEAGRDSAAARLEQARTRLADTRLFSPAGGTVLTRIREPGAMVREGAGVITVSISEPVWVRAYVPETQLGRIHPGMPASVYSDSLPGDPIQGRIGFISPEAEFTPKSVETPELRTQLVYRFRVVVTDPDNRLRQGMPVTIKLDQRARENAAVDKKRAAGRQEGARG